MNTDVVISNLLAFIGENFLEGNSADLTADTELLTLGILDSLNVFALLTHVMETFGVEVPLEDLTEANLQTLAVFGNLVSARLESAPSPGGDAAAALRVA